MGIRFAWGSIVLLAALAMVFFFCAVAKGDAPTLADRIAVLVPRYASKKTEPVAATELASAIDSACKHDRECAARLLTMAVMESGLSAAVSRSEYTEHQGDAYTDRDGVRQHLAWGTFQQHKNARNAADWGNDDLTVQARHARAIQAGALAECRKFRGVDPEVAMWRILSGRGCMVKFSGEDARQVLLRKIRKAL